MSSQNVFRISLSVFAILIALISVFYTNSLIEKLKEREIRLIKLYANGLETMAKSDDVGNLAFMFQEIIQANTSVPVILTDHKGAILSYKNLNINETTTKQLKNEAISEALSEMQLMYAPIEIEYSPGLKNYVYYKNSELLYQLQYYPYVQLSFIFLFVLLGYVFIQNSMRSEQNRVWVGMSKETAHQLATPLSSLIAWIEIFKSDPNFSAPEALSELDKDVKRLETITSRFSNIGSIPVKREERMYDVVCDIVGYLEQRTSKKVAFHMQYIATKSKTMLVNKSLLEWALENIIKNGIDAMSGQGSITIVVYEEKKYLTIEISDTGKGILKKHFNRVFRPGFTTKQRGWGLGLTLTKRIIEEYHNGKVYVKQSELGKGTTFAVRLPF